MNHRLVIASVGGAYLGTMSGVIAWAAVDWFIHVWRPAHR